MHNASSLIIKVCGMRDAANIRDVEALQPDWMGFICWEGSPRNVESCPAYLPHCVRVGVFVEPTLEFVKAKISQLGLNRLQLHGKETPERCAEIGEATGLPITKAVSVASEADVARAYIYNKVKSIDSLLFDTRSAAMGGSGRSFDWATLRNYNGKPFLLSGGIGPDDAARVKAFRHTCLMGIDVNSRFETSPAVKDITALRNFIYEMRKYE